MSDVICTARSAATAPPDSSDEDFDDDFEIVDGPAFDVPGEPLSIAVRSARTIPSHAHRSGDDSGAAVEDDVADDVAESVAATCRVAHNACAASSSRALPVIAGNASMRGVKSAARATRDPEHSVHSDTSTGSTLDDAQSAAAACDPIAPDRIFPLSILIFFRRDSRSTSGFTATSAATAHARAGRPSGKDARTPNSASSAGFGGGGGEDNVPGAGVTVLVPAVLAAAAPTTTSSAASPGQSPAAHSASALSAARHARNAAGDAPAESPPSAAARSPSSARACSIASCVPASMAISRSAAAVFPASAFPCDENASSATRRIALAVSALGTPLGTPLSDVSSKFPSPLEDDDA
mmetsp:Transcript_4758/g.16974  ORF Transcript_4758/g.16974 Transcript_4758/m.16974 type:complete len:352 (-) Transcript_4758:109-1164(-)